jgi:photosystem II stability/assembly factor-like uncharacterized protein
MFTNWSRGLFVRPGSKARPRQRRAVPKRSKFVPRLEGLEERSLMSFGPLSPTAWTAVGPAAISAPGVAEGFTAGRIAAAAPDPTDSNTMFIAAHQGGVWKTSNWNKYSDQGGPVWIPLTDDKRSLQFSYVSYHPLVVLKGNSTIPGGNDVVVAAMSGVGAGLLESADGGLSWKLVGNETPFHVPIFEGQELTSVVVPDASLKTMYVAVVSDKGGVWKTDDSGASWTNVTPFHKGGVSDLVMDANGDLYAGLVGAYDPNDQPGVYKSTDQGKTWLLQVLPINFLPGSSLFPTQDTIRLEVARSSPGTVYVSSVFEWKKQTLSAHFRTADGGEKWSRLAPIPGGFDRIGHVVLGVDPLLANHVIASAAYSLYESFDGGSTWSRFDKGRPNGDYIGDDWVNLSWDAANRPVPTADRDLYAFNPYSGLLDSREGNLQVTEFYTIALDPNNTDVLYGVAQDQLSALATNGSIGWHYAGGHAETGKVLVDPTDSNILFLSNPVRTDIDQVERSLDGGKTWELIKTDSAFPGEHYYDLAYPSVKNFTMDPSNPQRLLIGTTQVYETTDARDPVAIMPAGPIIQPLWKPISPVLSNFNAPITALAIAPSDPKTIYAATRDGTVWVTTKGGGLGEHDWFEMDAGLFFNKHNNPDGAFGQVWQFLIDPTNATHVFAVTNDKGPRNVWYLDQASAQWQNMSGDFPKDLLSRTMYVDWRFKIPVLYVGTTRGVYQSVNLGANWELFGNFLPNTQVEDLQGLPDKNILAAGTYGRGAWEISMAPSSVTGRVFLYLDGNSTQPGRDQGLAGALVYLDVNGTGVPAPNEYRTVTDAQGNYSFPMVPSSTYTVRVALPPEFSFTTPSAYRVTLAGSRETGKDFGVQVPPVLSSDELQELLNQVRQLGRELEQELEEAEQSFRTDLLGERMEDFGESDQDQPEPISTFSLSDFNMRGGQLSGTTDEPLWLLPSALQEDAPLWAPSWTLGSP